MQQAAGLTHRIKSIFTFERIFILILILAFILRFWQLDLKLLHHDEAIHSWFCYELLTKGAWQYDPSYHGPFLYYVTAGMFALIGPSDFAARLLPSLFGFAIIPLVYASTGSGTSTKTRRWSQRSSSPYRRTWSISPASSGTISSCSFSRCSSWSRSCTSSSGAQTRFAVLAAVAAAGALSLQGGDAGHHHRLCPLLCLCGMERTVHPPAAVEGRPPALCRPRGRDHERRSTRRSSSIPIR